MMDALHASFAIVGAGATLTGTVAAVCGTYLMTRAYHPFSVAGYFTHLKDAPLLAMAYLKHLSRQGRTAAPGEDAAEQAAGSRSGQEDEVESKMNELKLLAEMALVNKDNRALLLLGTDLLFIGFALQVVGGICAVVDLAWSHLAPPAAHM